ncbi:unnamed protein product, partial [marine sediment metagenome]
NGIEYSSDGINCNDSDITLTDCIIADSGNRGISCSNSDPNITNCVIKDNGDDGISCDNGCDVIVHNCIIERNDGEGVYDYEPSSAVITNNIIRWNGSHGVYYYSMGVDDAAIKNNWIHNNGTDNNGHGIYIDSALQNTVVVRNNTVVNNDSYGISSSRAVDDIRISNCIIWDNDDGQLYNCTATYSCIENGDTSNGNINDDPCFVDDTDPNDYHLSSDSLCIDKGNLSGNYDDETDIDGEDRLIDGDANGTARVDMGADE